MMADHCTVNQGGGVEIETAWLTRSGKESGYRTALALARTMTAAHFGEYLLISWYERDRDYESPSNTTECGAGCPKNGDIICGLSRGATSRADIGAGRPAFFFVPVEW